MRMQRSFGAIVVCVLWLTGCATMETPNRDTLCQQSTIDALLAANYQGNLSFGELGKKGDFGIGTFNDLDGEMICLDGHFYQIKSDGNVYPVAMDMKTPFATVSFFETDIKKEIQSIPDYSSLEYLIDGLLPTVNIFYAIKIAGTFSFINVRSVPRQEKPYQPLVQVVKQQPVYSYKNVKGTLVGFRCPAFVNGINVPGYHFHFINASRTKGGHVLDCQIEQGTVEIDSTHDFSLRLLQSESFYKTGLGKDRSGELKKVEK